MPSPLARESLLTLKGRPGWSNYGARPSFAPTGNRNQAKSMLAAKMLGDESLADGSISQLDLEEGADVVRTDALKKLLLPKQVEGDYDLRKQQIAGQYGVEAAKQSRIGQSERDALLFGNRMTAQNDAQAASAERAAAGQTALASRTSAIQQANAKAAGLRQQYSALAAQLKTAGTGGILSYFGGENPKAKIQAQMDALAQQMAAEAPAAIEGEVPGAPAAAGGDMASRLAAYRAARGGR